MWRGPNNFTNRTEFTIRLLKDHPQLEHPSVISSHESSLRTGVWDPGKENWECYRLYSLLLRWLFNVSFAGQICPVLSLSSFFSFLSSHLLSLFFTFIIFLLKGITLAGLRCGPSVSQPPETVSCCPTTSYCPLPSPKLSHRLPPVPTIPPLPLRFLLLFCLYKSNTKSGFTLLPFLSSHTRSNKQISTCIIVILMGLYEKSHEYSLMNLC